VREHAGNLVLARGGAIRSLALALAEAASGVWELGFGSYELGFGV